MSVSKTNVQKSVQSPVVRTVPTSLSKSRTAQAMDVDQKSVQSKTDSKLPSSSSSSGYVIIPKSVNPSCFSSKSSTTNTAGPVTGATASVITRSAADKEKLIALYRASSGSNGGESGESGGMRNKHYQAGVVGNFNPFTLSSGTISSCLNDSILAGTDWDNRVGEGIVNRHITMREQWIWAGCVNNYPPTTSLTQLVPLPIRRIVFWDRMPQLGNPTVSQDILGPTIDFDALLCSAGVTATAGFENLTQSAFNINTHGFRYDVVSDEIIRPEFGTLALSPQAITNAVPVSGGTNAVTATYTAMTANAYSETHINLKDKVTQYMTQSGGAITSITTNALYVVWLYTCDPANISVPHCASMIFDLAFQDTQS